MMVVLLLIIMRMMKTSEIKQFVFIIKDWKQPKQLKCAYTQTIPHINKKLSSLIAL